MPAHGAKTGPTPLSPFNDPDPSLNHSPIVFTGLPHAHVAEQMGISRSTADRAWVFARAWLYDRIRSPDEPAGENQPLTYSNQLPVLIELRGSHTNSAFC